MGVQSEGERRNGAEITRRWFEGYIYWGMEIEIKHAKNVEMTHRRAKSASKQWRRARGYVDGVRREEESESGFCASSSCAVMHIIRVTLSV